VVRNVSRAEKTRISSGVYYLALQTDGHKTMRRITIVR